MNRPDLATVLRSLGGPDVLAAWADDYGHAVSTAVAACPSREWLLWMATALRRGALIHYQPLTLAVCGAARTVLRDAPADDPRPLAAVEMAEAFARHGRVDLRDLARVRRGACDAAAEGLFARDAGVVAEWTTRAAARAYKGERDYTDAAERVLAVADRAGHGAECMVILRRELGPWLERGLRDVEVPS